MTIWAQEIKELERLYESFKGHYPDLEKELERLITTEDENMVLLYSRRCLEVIITNLCETELNRPRKTEPLKGIIDKLNKEEKVPSHIITSMDHLNGLSTYGAHPKEFDPQQVRTVLINLSTVLSWYLKFRSPEQETNSKHIRSMPDSAQIIKKHKIIPWKVISLILMGLMVLIILSFWLIWHKTYLKQLPLHRFSYFLPQGETIGSEKLGSSVTLSRDGTSLIYVSRRNDTNFLYLQVIDQLGASLITGTEGADAPFFSPDGNWVGFFANGYLKKISVLGGSSQTICEANFGFEGCWSEDNTIIFSSYYTGIMRVSSTGGTPEQITTSLRYSNDRLDRSHLWPQFLPGNKIILYTSFNNVEDMHIMAYSLETGKTWNLVESGSHAQYLRTGYLVYAWKGEILAVQFDIKRMKVTGQPAVVQKNVLMTGPGLSHFCLSDNGSFVFIPGTTIEPEDKLLLVDRNGREKYLDFPAGRYQSPRFSPDGENILIARSQEKSNLWIYGMNRGTISRFSEKEKDSFWGIWTPDGKRIVFNQITDEVEHANLFWKRVDGTGQSERLLTSNYHQQPKCWTPDGKFLIYTEGINPETGMDIWVRPMAGDSTPKQFLNSRFNEAHPNLSPDGRWLAYVSDESGREEVFVCSFPGKQNITQISNAGGTEPLWATDGKNIYFRDWSGNKVMIVSFIAEPEPKVGKPLLLFEGKYKGSVGLFGSCYDLSPDGKHFLVIEQEGMKSAANQINMILNWDEELNKLVPNN